MLIQSSKKLRKLSCSIFISFIICISFLVLNCAPTRYDLSKPEIKNEIEELINSWAANDNHDTRKKIIHELERRKAVGALITCNYTALSFQSYIQPYNVNQTSMSKPISSTFIQNSQ